MENWLFDRIGCRRFLLTGSPFFCATELVALFVNILSDRNESNSESHRRNRFDPTKCSLEDSVSLVEMQVRILSREIESELTTNDYP